MSFPGYPTPQQGYSLNPPQGQPGYPGASQHHQPPPQGYPGSPQGQPQYQDRSQYQGHQGQYQPPSAPPPQSQGPPAQGGAVRTTETNGSFEGVQYSIAHRDSNSLLSLRLQPGVEVKGKPGAMVAMDATIQIKGKLKFSFKKMLKGGDLTESQFTGSGEVLLAPETWGDIVPIMVDGQTPWRFGKHSFLASTGGVVRQYKSQGLGKGIFSGEGLFVAEATGRGIIFVHALGAVIQRQLAPGEQWVVDNGHLVAWNAQYKVERIQAGGLFSASHTDEGLVCRFTGPGTVYLQTRNPDALISWINDQLPNNSTVVVA